MQTRVTEFRKLLAARGWSVHVLPRDDLDWWLDEVWELSSEWRQQGTRAFALFLVDPMNHPGSKPMVWAVGVAQDVPGSRQESLQMPVATFKSKRRAWTHDVGTLLTQLQEWRDKTAGTDGGS